MTTYSLTLRDDHEAQLPSHLLRGDGCEQAAYLICNLASIRFGDILKNRQSRLSGAFAYKNSVPRSSTYRSDRLGLTAQRAASQQGPD
jgi:hypothetical protein